MLLDQQVAALLLHVLKGFDAILDRWHTRLGAFDFNLDRLDQIKGTLGFLLEG